MERRFLLFLVLSFLIMVGYAHLMAWLRPPPAQKEGDPVKAEKTDKIGAAKPGEKEPQPAKAMEPAIGPAEEKPAAESTPPLVERKYPQRWVALGSFDPHEPYRMSVLVSSRGAALARVALNSERYRELDDRSGYLGQIVFREDRESKGLAVEVVEPGSPVAKAGLRGEEWEREENDWVLKRPGDLLLAVNGQPVPTRKHFQAVLAATKPRQACVLTVRREGQELSLPVTLVRRPLEVIKPEVKDGQEDPLSLLLTLHRLDAARLEEPEETVALGAELPASEGRPALRLWSDNWELLEASSRHCIFRYRVPGADIEILKKYHLAQVSEDEHANRDFPAYHLELQIELRNVGGRPREVAYQLDGPNGLPTEGHWYASTVSRSGGAAGLRDLVLRFDGQSTTMVNCPAIADNNVDKPWRGKPINFIGVSAQYFTAVLIPQSPTGKEDWVALSHPLRVGQVDARHKNLANVSFRLISRTQKLAPGQTATHRYQLFTGPKRSPLLAQYGLESVVYYGWPIFAWFAKPLVSILHLLYWILPNYGIAIVLLTVLVRGCMFPLSRKQVLNALKMQELQPEIKRIQEQYKGNREALVRAQQELWRKHNFNPLGGCLVLFVQLPIFIGLYRALMIDVELRQAPLLSENIRWCSNLAAPDMLLDWSAIMPDWINSGQGLLGLGPYLNILPILTIWLFLWQQKKMMPPPADEQAALQQKVMKYMMIFMAVLFYKVASGLCIYFIASSLWGLAERRFLPQRPPGAQSSPPQTRAEAKAAERDKAERDRPAAEKWRFPRWGKG